MSENPYQTPHTRTTLSSSHPDPPQTIAAIVRVNRVIHASLVMGVVVIAGIIAFTRRDQPEETNVLFLAIGGLIWLSTLVASFILPRLTPMPALDPVNPVGETAAFDANDTIDSGVGDLRSVIETIDADAMLPEPLRIAGGHYSTVKLIAAALVEGAAVVNTVLMMIASWGHAAFVAASIAILWIRMPSEGDVRDHFRRCVADGDVR